MVAGFGQGVPMASYIPGGYDYYDTESTMIISWQVDVLENDYLLPPIGPYVWSVSYALPEIWFGGNFDGNSTLTLELIQNSETYFAAMASLGISVLVASGDGK